MKKSQILAALALAFALGVVAPVAGANAKYATGYTTQQTNEMNNLVSYANILAASTKNLNNYISLYETIETADTGARAQLSKVITAAIKVYNDTPAKADSALNTLIRDAGLYGSVVFANDNLKQDANAEQATPFTLNAASSVGSTANDLKSAYDALSAVASNATKNAEILKQNYKYNASDATNQVTIAYNKYTEVVTSANYWKDQIENEISKLSVNATPALNALNAIDQDAYNAMLATDAWKNATSNTKTQQAVRWGLIIDLAEGLPKYSFVAPVINAKGNFDKLLPSNDTVVQFDQGKDYVSAYTNAIKAYRDGKAPIDPDDQQPTDPSNPSDDDNKGDDDNKTPTTPGTGIVSTAEGSASTTISIVAGLATALTALGAGVVAYRNARRSGEK